jgi:hypothetical protein
MGRVRGLDSIDLNSPDGREILSIIGTLNQSCEHAERTSIADEMREEHRRRAVGG